MNNEGHRTYDAHDSYGQFAVDWENRIDFDSLRKKRLQRARQKMKEHGLGALLLFRQDTIRYVTGTWQHPAGHCDPKIFRYTVLAGDGDPVHFETAGLDRICVERAATWLPEVRTAQIWASAGAATPIITKKFAKEIKEILTKNGVKKEKVGIDFVDFPSLDALQEEGIKLGNGLVVVQDAGMIKFPEELEILKQACAIADAAYARAEEVIKPGMRENELKAEIVKTLYDLGSERIEHITLASGGRTNPFWRHGPNDRMFRYGDMVLVDILHQYMGYRTCYYRNFVVGGKATQKQKDLYKQTYESMYKAINIIKPGVTTADVAEVWAKEGYSDDTYGAVSLLQFGHGLGVSNHEPPFITLAYSKDYPVELKPNMYLAVETYAGKPDDGEAARLEENFVITEDGVEIFSLYPLAGPLMDEIPAIK